MRLKIKCDWCLYDINESEYDEVPAIQLTINGDDFYFCCEECQDKFLKEYTKYVYITPKGDVIED